MDFWSKDEQVRLNETYDFIANKVPPGERTTVRAFLTNWVQRVYGAGSGVLSEAMSTRHNWGVGNAETRAGRRALVILRGDLLNPANPLKMTGPQIMAMPSGNVGPAVDALLPGFRIFAQQEENVNTALQIKLNAFKANPDTFLAGNYVVTQSMPSGTGIGAAVEHRFIFNYADQQFMLMPTATPRPQTVRGQGLRFNAVNVPEMFWFRVPGRGANPAAHTGTFAQIPATELTGADMMVTSAFTGCSFCFKNIGGTVYAAHISPDGTAANAGPSIGAAPALATQIIATGNFAAPPAAQAGAMQVFGRGLSNVPAHLGGYTVNALPGAPLTAASMYVYGVRIGGNWRIVFQQNDGGARTVGRLLG
jgi:hypothetical protein